jgi:hypothetical protein
MGRPAALDDRDKAILDARVAAFDPTEGPREGDYVDFTNGVTRRISTCGLTVSKRQTRQLLPR